MLRNQFLGQPDVVSFIQWLRGNLPTQIFNLNMAPSRYVPGGLQQRVVGLQAVLPHYIWKTSWTRAGTVHHSSDWATTHTSLLQLRQWIGQAVSLGNENDALAAGLEILRWGGVRGAIPFLNRLHSHGRLVAYLQRLKPLLALDNTPSQNLSQISAVNVERFDAGLTKIHSLLDDSGSPIYDSRVGAAMAMFYALYRQQTKDLHPAVLSFPSGGARGSQIRNPRTLNPSYPSAPQFFTNRVSREEWARWQVRLGWILRELLDRQSDWFVDEGSIAQRCHAFEACLFMVGYDLRCFDGAQITTETANPAHPALTPRNPGARGWVPTSHPFSSVISWYREYRQGGGVATAEGFQQWLITSKKYRESTARAYCFPLGENEFDLIGRNMDELELIEAGGQAGLYAALCSSEPYEAGNEREMVCLVDAWIVGRVVSLNSPEERRNALINAGFAGTENAANILLSVGRAVGHHFGLLDDNGNPTTFFEQFFGNANDDINGQLQAALVF